MVKIDLKDRKILYLMDLDSRQSLSQLGKKVGIAKNVVAYRLSKLEEAGIILSYYTAIDACKLGYMNMRFHFTYQYTTPEIEKQIIDYFIKCKYSMLVGSAQGFFDLSVILSFKSISDFSRIWQDIQNKFGYYFQQQTLSFYLSEVRYRRSYLMVGYQQKYDRNELFSCGGGKPTSVDDIDFNILQLLSHNSRMPLTEIASKVSGSSTMVKMRIKKLQKERIIQGFRTSIDVSKLGYHSIKVYIFLKEYKLRHELINYIVNNPHLICIDTATGESHLELEFHVESIRHLYEIMHDLITKFPGYIRNYQYASIVEVHKNLFIPEV